MIRPTQLGVSSVVGLAVARKLIVANGGRIEVRDNSPRGAVFRIAWPK